MKKQTRSDTEISTQVLKLRSLGDRTLRNMRLAPVRSAYASNAAHITGRYLWTLAAKLAPHLRNTQAKMHRICHCANAHFLESFGFVLRQVADAKKSTTRVIRPQYPHYSSRLNGLAPRRPTTVWFPGSSTARSDRAAWRAKASPIVLWVRTKTG